MELIKFPWLEGKDCSDGYPGIKLQVYLFLGSLILGFLFDFLFYGKPLGISYPLYVIAFYAILFWNMKQNKQPISVWTWLLGIPIIALSCTFVIFSNQFLAVLNFLMIPTLLVAHTLLLTSNNGHAWFESGFLADLMYGIFARPLAHCLKPFQLIATLTKPRAKLGKFKVAGKVLVGLLVAVPLLMVIVPLLAAADDMFNHFLGLIPNILQHFSINEFVAQVLIIIVVTCLMFSYLGSLFSFKSGLPAPFANTDNFPKPSTFLDPLSVTTVLAVINVLYAFFIAIQFSYLFGSLKYGLPHNFTYAQYARKGFFELVVVTVINLAILLGNMNFVKTSGSKVDKVVKVLNTALVVSTFVILLSAHFRMSLYEQAYGLTYLRVLTDTFMGYLSVLFIFTLYKIWRPTLPLFKSYIVISILAYTLVNYINIDSLIASNNVDRFTKGSQIDIMYLTTLSYDAVPQLVNFMHNTRDKGLAIKLEGALKSKQQALTRTTPWQSFNLAKYRAKEILR